MGIFSSMVFKGFSEQYDLISTDGWIHTWERSSPRVAKAQVLIEGIDSSFVGLFIDEKYIIFNIKSTLAQIGLDVSVLGMDLQRSQKRAEVSLEFTAYGSLAESFLDLLGIGCYVGKLFVLDPYRRVRDPFYLNRMFGRSDRYGKPLLSLGGLHGSRDLILDKVDGRCIAYVSLQPGVVTYEASIGGFLPTVAKALKQHIPMRELLSLHQKTQTHHSRVVESGEILLVKTFPLHIRTVFARVVDELLPPGFHHTKASVLQPDTEASGDIYEFHGQSDHEIADVPLEFYTLEPFREYVFFSDRDQLQSVIDDPKVFFQAFKTAPEPINYRAATFIVKGDQLIHLSEKDWVINETKKQDFPGTILSARQALMVERYIEQQPSYHYLKNIEDGVITSQGILLCRYFPTPLMKRLFLSDRVQRNLKGLYFYSPSKSTMNFFSHEDRSFLHDLQMFGIPVFWVDEATEQILQYVERPQHESGMFVPLNKIDVFLKASLFGIYGSNLISGEFEKELEQLLYGLIDLKGKLDHPLLNPDIPIALVTGGGPGAMEVGNRVAKEVGILSCANMVDFSAKGKQVVNEQRANPYVEAKMTYRIDRLVERQAEFHLDFPIFLKGGIGTDFEFYLEQVRRKVGAVTSTPILLFGEASYWEKKITSNFQCNFQGGTIKGSEWISNCFYVVQNSQEALKVYQAYFEGELLLGKEGPIYEKGFSSLPKTAKN